MEKNGNKMGVVQLTLITAINMLGSGIVMLPSKMAQVGTMSVFSWIVTLGGALCLSWGFARAAMFNKRKAGMGGYANYSFGHSGSFMTNYTYALSLVIANVAIAVSVVSYATVFLGIKLSPFAAALWAAITIVLTTVLNFWGSKITGKIGSFTVLGVIIPVVVLSVVGWFYFKPSIYVASWNPHHYGFFQGLGVSIPITLWAFLGLESAAVNMNTVRNPSKNVPIAVLGGTTIAAIIYIASTNVMAGIVKNKALLNSDAPFGLVFAEMWGTFWEKVVELMMVIACFGSLLAWQFTIAQVFKESADVGYFPHIFKKTTKHDAPVIGMTILMVIQVLISFMTASPDLNTQFNILVNLAVVTNLVPYVLSMASVNTIQEAAGVSRKSTVYRVTFVVVLLAEIYSLYAMYECGSLSMVLGSLVTFAGWVFYSFVSHKFDVAIDMKYDKTH